MSTKDRKQRQFIEREQIFLAKACELIKRDGLLNLQMNRIAEACEYSVGTLYQHFKSKEDMLLALVNERIGERLALFEKVANWQANTRDRMLGFIFADLLFATTEPLFFQLHQYLSTPVIAAAITPACREYAILAHQPLADIFIALIEEAQAQGDISLTPITPMQLGLGLWALIEGMHTFVHADGLSEAYRFSSPYSLLLHHVQAMLNGHNWLPLCPLDDVAHQQQLVERLAQEVLTEFSDSDFALLLPKAI